ncbi:MAG TPA: VWA domain-containing protein [Pyrinomonadaceae bacterium]|nr:VWA domain-containing protein [Pyrinomonadaceae bacterium]
MKRIITLVLLSAFAGVLAQTASAQTRPRRVGQTQTSQQQDQQSQPQPTPGDASAASRSSRPPVLGGANRNPNEQQPASTSTQNPGPEEVSEGDIVRVNTTLVSIPVSVMDRDGKYIPNLRKEDFRIWEDGVEQQVAYFASTEKPFTVALLIDTSGSTRFKLEEIQDAAIAFVNQLRADDRVMIVSFNDKIRVLTPQPTNDRALLRSAIRQTEAGNGTRLYDAVDQVINQYLNRIEGRKAIVLFTDGVDTTSKHASYEDNVRDAEELDALIYPVEYDTSTDTGVWNPGTRGGGRRGGGSGGGGQSSGNVVIDILGSILGGGSGNSRGNGGGNGGGGYPGGRGGGRGGRGGGGWPGGGGAGDSREEYERGDRYLHDLARVSGGRLYNAEQQNLDAAFRSVAEELRRQYSLGYYPKKAPQPGERRAIKVRVDRPELAVRARDSYVFQPGANNSAQGQTNSQPKPPVLKKELRGSF